MILVCMLPTRTFGPKVELEEDLIACFVADEFRVPVPVRGGLT
jgi:hypothetical protein